MLKTAFRVRLTRRGCPVRAVKGKQSERTLAMHQINGIDDNLTTIASKDVSYAPIIIRFDHRGIIIAGRDSPVETGLARKSANEGGGREEH